MTIREALEAVVTESNNEYAKTYAQAALELGEAEEAVIVQSDKLNMVAVCPKITGKMMIGEELRVQLLYVLSNLSYWRGDRAREVKATLKRGTIKCDS